jgi:hypothetical protein
MSMLSIFNVSGSAASAQSQRLNVVASNLANADTVAGPNGQAYKARQVTFQTELMGQTANDPTAAGVTRQHDQRGPDAGPARPRPQAPERRCRGLRHLQQRQRGRGDGQHDLGLALVPEQPRSDEHRQVAAAEDDPARPGLIDSHRKDHHGRQRTQLDRRATSPSPRRPPHASTSDSTVTADRFLKLLVAQMQNQDPLNPMDNAQVTSQMAQINTVTGIDKLNSTVQACRASSCSCRRCRARRWSAAT